MRPLRLIIEPPRVQLLGLTQPGPDDPPVLFDIDRIESLQTLDSGFHPPAIDVADSIVRAVKHP